MTRTRPAPDWLESARCLRAPEYKVERVLESLWDTHKVSARQRGVSEGWRDERMSATRLFSKREIGCYDNLEQLRADKFVKRGTEESRDTSFTEESWKMEVECLALKDLSSPRKSFKVEEENGGQSEQKENICLERRRSTPLKSNPSVPVMMFSRKGATPDLAHTTPIKHSTLVEPLTPTANLKMLISAASPDIRDREMKKVLFRPIENEREKPVTPVPLVEEIEVEDPCQFEAVEEEDDADKKPSRKQKSLGLLCQKFLALYPDCPPPQSHISISLDEVATNLGVERRRIYDIINVLESLMMVGRIAKNSYTWFGRQRLEATLEELQRRGQQQGYHLQMELATTEAREGGVWREEDRAEGDASNACGNRKDKSLRIMSQKFVMLFLVSKTQTVTLDAAAKILIEESQDSSSHSKYKTKVRRLYDIANVLTSLDLIKKVHVREERGRKPAFKWLGPVEFKHSASSVENAVNVAHGYLPGAIQPVDNQDLRRAKMVRHASFNITPTSLVVQRQVSSAPCSPQPESAALQNQPLDYSKRAINGTACRLQCGNITDNHPATLVQTSACSSLQPPSSTHPTLLTPSLQPEQFFSPSSSPHCMAYLPSLSQPSVVTLYRPEQVAEGKKSAASECEEGKKRKRDGSEEETVVKKKGICVSEGWEKLSDEGAGCSQMANSTMSPHQSGEHMSDEGPGSSEPAQFSHYLYVPNNAGLNSLNFLLSAGQQPASLALNPSNVPTLAVPYVLLPSTALSHYRLVANGHPQPGSDAHTKLSFSVPAVMSPGHLMVGGVPYSLVAGSEMSRSPVPSPSTPEQSRIYGAASGAPNSPSGPRQTISINTPEPMTPQTPKETAASGSKAFFQTPCTLGNVVSVMPAARKKGSAQRRLDVGHPVPSLGEHVASRVEGVDP